MHTSSTVTIREILRNHKRVLEHIKTTKERVTVVSQDEPQVGIVSLDDLQKLEELDKKTKYQASTKSLIDTVKKIREVIKDEHLPADLSTRHDFYHYETTEKHE
jgi:PHD/YefM family antitoxin component YafN of YafNO toxin-antitoxin module